MKRKCILLKMVCLRECLLEKKLKSIQQMGWCRVCLGLAHALLSWVRCRDQSWNHHSWDSLSLCFTSAVVGGPESKNSLVGGIGVVSSTARWRIRRMRQGTWTPDKKRTCWEQRHLQDSPAVADVRLQLEGSTSVPDFGVNTRQR